ncbi:MAG: hypothetical protein MI867_18855 [Pseudomonadales bacterium]|nr:hypothetical protein [Pseudomonadales bacterium]
MKFTSFGAHAALFSLFTLVAAPVSADNRGLLSDIYFEGGINSGQLDFNSGETEIDGLSFAIGTYFENNYFVQGKYSSLEVRNTYDAQLARLVAGYETALNQSSTAYFAAGGFLGDDDFEDGETGGLALSVGVTWGSPQYRLVVSYDYYHSDTDTPMHHAEIFGVSFRYQPGGNNLIYSERKGDVSSLQRTVACDPEHAHLFSSCLDKE